MKFNLFLVVLLFSKTIFSQNDFDYSVYLKPVEFPNLIGLHSFATAQIGSKILLVGGRRDGVHARQPFNAFPESKNNDSIYVIDLTSKEIWSKSLESLPINLKEQLQSTNMCFFQDADTLTIIGGYAYSSSALDHITFPYLITISVSNLINHVVLNQDITTDFKQIQNEQFAITGGELNKIGNTYFLVGGHHFDGRYNPMNNPTFTQTYLNGLLKFTLNNAGNQIQYSILETVIDPIHLHRRDFNLLSQIDANNEKMLLISSGVFQLNENLPFLYPVEIKADTHLAITNFNQYLSNYHSAKVSLFHSNSQSNYSIFFGGISQYYYENNTLINDPTVPFINTISLLKAKNGMYEEFKFETEMPSLKGSGAHFYINENLATFHDEIISMDNFTADSILIGHIFGGIESSSKSAFTDNETSLTSADKSLYEVYLVKNNHANLLKIEKPNTFNFTLFPNPNAGVLNISFNLEKKAEIYFYLTNLKGEIIDEGLLAKCKKGENINKLNLDKKIENQVLFLTISKDYLEFHSEKFILNR